jgi:hypothetical protein
MQLLASGFAFGFGKQLICFHQQLLNNFVR